MDGLGPGAPGPAAAAEAGGAAAEAEGAAGEAEGARVPRLIVFDLDACLWSPEMFELNSAPRAYDKEAGGVRAGHDVVRLFPGAAAVLRALQTDARFAHTEIAVASSTTEPAYANTCLDQLVIGADDATVGSLVQYREIYPSNKGRAHFPALRKELFWRGLRAFAAGEAGV